jgi:hypothetical protein
MSTQPKRGESFFSNGLEFTPEGKYRREVWWVYRYVDPASKRRVEFELHEPTISDKWNVLCTLGVIGSLPDNLHTFMSSDLHDAVLRCINKARRMNYKIRDEDHVRILVEVEWL